MIAVLADDFTGAAEMAGISFRYGLETVIHWSGKLILEDMDVCIACSDSRSLPQAQAMEVTERMVNMLKAIQPYIYFKKTDSVLRGYVLDELHLQLNLLELKRALFIPANPSFNRIIHNGVYLVNGQPLDQTPFREDPEFPTHTSDVKQLLESRSKFTTQILTKDAALNESGIMTAEVQTVEDIRSWVDQIRKGVLLAGAGDFFTECLANNNEEKLISKPGFDWPLLYVSGTSFKASQEYIRQVANRNQPVFYMDLPLLEAEEQEKEVWIRNIAACLKENNKAILAIDPKLELQAQLGPVWLRSQMAIVVHKIIVAAGALELFVEGGSTAAAILHRLDIAFMEPVAEFRRGVVKMKCSPGDLMLTVKPGSYPLPEQVLERF
jgi:uncharacterized protein YgbK (DUF1537 family)